MKSLFACFVLACVAAVGSAGCEDVEELYNCALICESYEDCAGELGQDVDYTDCVDHCEAEADQDAQFNRKAQDCQDCLEQGDSCVDSFVCAAECGDVVPTVLF